MTTKIQLGDIVADITLKDIKNLRLSVHPPSGAVRISAPLRMNLDAIRIFALSKLGWIRKQQQKLRDQEREIPREYLDREGHYFLGKRYLLEVIEMDAAPRVAIRHDTLVLQVRPGAGDDRKKSVINEWYRQQLKARLPEVIETWESVIGVQVAEWGIKKMKTRWGTCNINARRVWLNLELARKSPQCLEYVLVHEMVHLLERRHNHRFRSLMDRFLPNWRLYQDELNRAPLACESREY
jgi:predicted metal-dependent hydrolase